MWIQKTRRKKTHILHLLNKGKVGNAHPTLNQGLETLIFEGNLVVQDVISFAFVSELFKFPSSPSDSALCCAWSGFFYHSDVTGFDVKRKSI